MPAIPWHRLVTPSFWGPPPGGLGLPDHRRQVLILALAWLVATLLLFLCRPGYTFPPMEVIDSWVYTGYQWNLRGHIKEFGPLYYGARLSWIIPGAILHGLLPPVAANICFKLLVSSLLATACGVIVYGTLGFRGALLAVVLSVFCPQIIYALHWDYVDIAVITYGALTLAGITLAKDSKNWPAWILFSGGMFAFMVVANLTSWGFPGLGIAFYHLLWLRWSLRRQLICLALYLAAAVVVLAGLGLIHLGLGGDFLFMQPQFAMLSQLKAPEGNFWAPPNWHWVPEATWLVLPVSALLWGLFRAAVARSPDARIQLLTVALTGALASSLAVAAILEICGQPVAYFYYYASFHLCLAVPLLVVCCLSSPVRKNASALWFFGSLLLLAVIIIAFDNYAVAQRLIGHLPFVPSFSAIPVMAATLLLVLAPLVVLGARHRFGRLLQPALRAELLFLGIVTCSMPFGFYAPNESKLLRERYEAVHAAFGVIDHEFANGSYRLWGHPRQRGSMALTSTRLWGYRLFTQKPFPQFDTESVAILADRRLVITAPATRGNQTLAEAKSALARFAEITHEQIIPVPGAAGTGFDLVVLSLKERPVKLEAPEAGQDTTSALLDLVSNSSTPYVEMLEKNLYGSANRIRTALTTTAEATLFTRTDPRDHLATHFQKFTVTKRGGRRLEIIVQMPCDSKTLMVVQDETFQFLAQISLQKAGQHHYVVDLPADPSSFRLHFSSPTDAPTALPERVTIYETGQK